MLFENFTNEQWAGLIIAILIIIAFNFILYSKCITRGKHRDPDEIEEFLFQHGDLEGRKLMKISQYDVIHNHLKTKGAITSLQAIKMYGITRLAAVIYELRKRGISIISETIEVTNRHGEVCQVAQYILNK